MTPAATLPGQDAGPRTISIHQPAYLPWLGYFDKIRSADCFVYLDTVQFQKQSFQNRNKIRTADGWVWLTVPVETKGKLYDTQLKDLTINPRVDWRRKHRASIEMNYRKAPHYDAVMAWLAPFYDRDWPGLSDLCFEMMLAFNRALGIETEIVKASDLTSVEGSKGDLVLNLCRALDADRYLSGSLGRDYLDPEAFQTAGIDLTFQSYEHPSYQQAYPGFEPYMAVIDLLMNQSDPAAHL